MDQDLLTVDEAAIRLRVSQDTVRRLLRQSRLPGLRVGGQWRISAAALREFIEKGGQAATKGVRDE